MLSLQPVLGSRAGQEGTARGCAAGLWRSEGGSALLRLQQETPAPGDASREGIFSKTVKSKKKVRALK